jgi:hypothetical protein
MNIKNNKIVSVLFSAVILMSCTKEDIGPLTDNKPKVSVTVQNAADYRPEPTVTTALSGTGAIQIILSIPASSGRTIKEITKVAANTTYSQIQGSTGLYTSTPIAGSGTTVTFNTSLTEYFAKKPVSASNPAAKVNTELGNRFYFLVTLDDGSVIIPESVRVLVL